MPSISDSRALKCSARMAIVSIVPNQSTATMIRNPGSGYGIHVSACVHASSDASMSPGHSHGMWLPVGQSANSLVTSQRTKIVAMP